MEERDFGLTTDGRRVKQFVLSNDQGVSARILNYGAIVSHLFAPDREGTMADIVLGHASVEAYERENTYAGAIVGRVAGRITGGRFSIEGREYQATRNEGINHTHGGVKGFDKMIWDHQWTTVNGRETIVLSLKSPHGDEGYPGNLEFTVSYYITRENGLRMDYRATTDQSTLLNVTNHSYFNLAGEGGGDVSAHFLQINASRYSLVDENFSNTGIIEDVNGRPNDFRNPVMLGERFGMIHKAHGDHYLLDKPHDQFGFAARATETGSGRTMDVFTTQSCLQFYTGKHLNTMYPGKAGQRYRSHYGFCLECQDYPMATAFPGFRSITLHPGEIYSHSTEYRFGTE